MLWTDCKNDKTSNVQIELIDNSPFHLKGTFKGPEDTPYEGGRFDVVSLVHYYLIAATKKINLVLPWWRSTLPSPFYIIGHCDPRSLPIPTRKDEIPHQSLPPERLLRFRRHLSRHPQGRLVPRPYPQIHSDLAPVASVFA